MDTLFASIPIAKSTDNGDGTITVYGRATDSSIDADDQMMDPAFLRKAMTEWFKSYGNIREQHQNVAAGKAISLEEKNGEWWLKALVVDKGTVAKVKSKVLNDFSIGIRLARVVKDMVAKGGRIVDGHIYEVSLVDRGSNFNTQFMIAKAFKGDKEMTLINKTIDPVTGEVIETTETAPTGETEATTETAPTGETEATTETAPTGETAPVIETPAGETSATTELSEEIKSLIVKTVESATAEATKETNLTKSLLESKEAEIVSLKKQLADVLAKPAAGGPARTALIEKSAVDKTELRDAETEFARLTNLAKTVTDQSLAKGYKLLAGKQQEIIATLNK